VGYHNSINDIKHWTVEVSVDEYPRRTQARARLHWRGGDLVGVGIARLNPADRDIAEIGDELALSNLANHLFAAGAWDIEAVNNEPVATLR
jgi:hypothetical protein